MRHLTRPAEPLSKAVGLLLTDATLAKVPLAFLASDFHSDTFNGTKNTDLPQFDQGLPALIEDLHERGLDKDVAVVAWGEFGRTPKINKDAGCDQLARCRWRPAGLWWISQWPSDWGN